MSKGYKTFLLNVVAPQSGLPTWYAGMTAGTWAQPTSNTLDSVAYKPMVDPLTYSGLSLNSIAQGYSGGLVDNVNREFLLIGNGGHSDYVGNEGYALALGANVPYWYRLNDPTPTPAGNPQQWIWPSSINSNVINGTTRFYDGRSTSMHTYGIPQIVNGRVWFQFQGHTTGGAGSWISGVCSYNRNLFRVGSAAGAEASGSVAHPGVVDAGPWEFWGGITANPHGFDSGNLNAGYCVYDPNTNKILTIHTQSASFIYFMLNPATGVTQTFNQGTLGSPPPAPPAMTNGGMRWYSTVIPDRAIASVSAVNGLLTWFHKGDPANIFLMSTARMGLSTSTPIWVQRPCTGTVPTFNSSDYTGTGFAVYWNGAIYYMDWSISGSAIYKLTIPADVSTGSFVWSQLPNTGGADGPAVGTPRCYGRFNIVQLAPNAAAVVCQHQLAKPWIYKLP